MTSNQIMKLVFVVILLYSTQACAKSYHLFEKKLNFFAAFQDCASRNMNMATIYSQSEQSDLEKAIKQAGKESTHLYIGGTDLGANGTYSWLATGHAFSFTKWTPGEPTNHPAPQERCVIAWPHPPGTISWNNVPCNNEYEYICEDKESQVININFECPTCNC